MVADAYNGIFRINPQTGTFCTVVCWLPFFLPCCSSCLSGSVVVVVGGGGGDGGGGGGGGGGVCCCFLVNSPCTLHSISGKLSDQAFSGALRCC